MERRRQVSFWKSGACSIPKIATSPSPDFRRVRSNFWRSSVDYKPAGGTQVARNRSRLRTERVIAIDLADRGRPAEARLATAVDDG